MKIEAQKKIQIGNILLVICICLITNFITAIFIINNKSPTVSQSININADKKNKVNLNTASLEQLKNLQGIGESKANEIIKNRPYSSAWDLKKIRGFGDETIRNLEEVVTCE